MMSENNFNEIFEKAKNYAYSSMNYIEFEECKNAEIMHNNDNFILLRDKSKSPHMLYFAANNFEDLLAVIEVIPDKLRLHFVPRPYVKRLEALGFTEWGEYVDFWNNELTQTATKISTPARPEFLSQHECVVAAEVSQKCRLQSRGFEGETEAWFTQWLDEGKVIIVRNGTTLAGFCCVSIYNEGTTLWIREIAVDPAFQGQDYGKKLIAQAIQYGAENGAIKGFLLADILNENAIGLYAKYNFHATGTDSEIQMIRG